MNKLIVIKENENSVQFEIPLYFAKLTEYDLKKSDENFETRIIKSKFYGTKKHLLIYPHKVIV